MGLPYMIEYLLSRSRGQGYLVTQSVSQTIVPAVPAGIEFSLALLPVGSDYANLVYDSALNPDMVPNAFYGVAQYSGNQVISGILTNNWVQQMNDSFLIVSRTLPAVLTIRNRTNISQFYGGIIYFVSIKTEGTYKEVLQELERVGSSKMEGLAKEANQLLGALTQRLGVPRPPLGGSS